MFTVITDAFTILRNMNIVRNIIGVIVGWLVGSAVNFGLVIGGMSLFPLPAGADFWTPEGATAAIQMMQPVHFMVPFVAHAIGTLVAAFVAVLIAASYKFHIALGLGVLFLLGGIYAAVSIDAPLWFEALDLVLAYIPFALLGGWLGGAFKKAS